MSQTMMFLVRSSNWMIPWGDAEFFELGDELRHLARLDVRDRERLRKNRLERLLRVDGLFLVLFDPAAALLLVHDLVGGRDPDDVFRLADLRQLRHVGLEDEVERLVPRHVGQLDRDRPLHLGPGDEVQPGDLGDQTQDVVDVRILEIQREPSTGEAGCRENRRRGSGGRSRRGCRRGRNRVGRCDAEPGSVPGPALAWAPRLEPGPGPGLQFRVRPLRPQSSRGPRRLPPAPEHRKPPRSGCRIC